MHWSTPPGTSRHDPRSRRRAGCRGTVGMPGDTPGPARADAERRRTQAAAGGAGSTFAMAPAANAPTADRTSEGPRLTRRRNVLLAQHHRERGWSIAQIAHLLDRTPATIRGYLHDPTGEKAKRRKASYAGTCGRCGTPTSGADGKRRAPRHCQRCKPQSRPRWTRALVRGAHRFWFERFGFVASSVDWSATHAHRRGGAALERYRAARWPSQSVVRRLYGTPAAASADAFPSLTDPTNRGPAAHDGAPPSTPQSGPGGPSAPTPSATDGAAPRGLHPAAGRARRPAGSPTPDRQPRA